MVHPGAGNKAGTLVNALLNHDKELAFLPRAGIVHRLDKDTSGIMVTAKNEFSYLNIVSQWMISSGFLLGYITILCFFRFQI